MLYAEEKIAKKYSLAFLNTFEKTLSDQICSNLEKLEEFLRLNRRFYVALRIRNITLIKKREVLNKISELFALGDNFKTLMHLLLDSGRIELLDKVTSQIIRLHKKRQKIAQFTISTSHQISDASKIKINDFAEKLTSSKIETKFKIDPSLIMGISIESGTLLWVRSINKKLNTLKN